MLLSQKIYDQCAKAYPFWPKLLCMIKNDDPGVLYFLRTAYERFHSSGISYDAVLTANYSLEELQALAQKEKENDKLREQLLTDCYNEYVSLYGEAQAEIFLTCGG